MTSRHPHRPHGSSTNGIGVLSPVNDWAGERTGNWVARQASAYSSTSWCPWIGPLLRFSRLRTPHFRVLAETQGPSLSRRTVVYAPSDPSQRQKTRSCNWRVPWPTPAGGGWPGQLQWVPCPVGQGPRWACFWWDRPSSTQCNRAGKPLRSSVNSGGSRHIRQSRALDQYQFLRPFHQPAPDRIA